VRAAFARFSEPARASGLVVLPAMAFYGGLGDLLATMAMGDWAAAGEIEIGVALDSWKPTVGTRVTGRRNTGPRVVVSQGRLVLLPDPPLQRPWRFPEPLRCSRCGRPRSLRDHHHLASPSGARGSRLREHVGDPGPPKSRHAAPHALRRERPVFAGVP